MIEMLKNGVVDLRTVIIVRMLANNMSLPNLIGIDIS